jgi:hypothetical protein
MSRGGVHAPPPPVSLAGAGVVLLLLASAAACGRIGYDPSASDASVHFDAAADDRGMGGGDSGRTPDGGTSDRSGDAGDASDAGMTPDGDGGPGSCAPRTLCTLVDGFDQPALASNLLAYSDGTCLTGLSAGAFFVTLSGAANKFCGLGSVGTLVADGTLTIDSSGFPTGVSGLIVYFQIQDPSSYVEFQLTGTTLRLNVNTSSGTTQKASMTYSPAAHRYWRFQASAAAVAYQTSPDGNTWTTQTTTPPPFTGTSVQMDIGAGFLSTGSTVTITLPGVNAP